MKKEGNISRKVKLWFSFPNVWVSVCIGIFAVASIIASKYLLLEGNTFESSVFSNIFAGLLTGFVISLLSGVKAVYSSYLEAR